MQTNTRIRSETILCIVSNMKAMLCNYVHCIMNRALYSPILYMFTVHTHTCRRPISACWYVTTPGSVTYHPVDPNPTDQPSPAPSHNFTCRVMNDVFLLEPMSFPTAGQYVFVAEFHNSASQANNTVSFEVVQGE